MTTILINHRRGGQTNLKARKTNIVRGEQKKVLLGEDIITITIQVSSPIEIELGDKIDIFGATYTVNQLPTIQRRGSQYFEQTITLEGLQSELLDVQFMLPGNMKYDSLTGDITDFLDIIIQNANRLNPGKWMAGAIPENTKVKTLSYSENNCLQVLQKICEEWGTEFEITMSESGLRTIHLKQVGVQFPITFKYGRTGGLYDLLRQNVNSKNVVSRLYVYGGSKNISNIYRGNKLCLPGKEKNDSYIESTEAITLYGLKENVKTFDEIYPNRYGVVTSLGEDVLTFTDDTMDFDLNETVEEDPDTTKWLIHGIDAKVRFTTGNLAGYEFDLHKYDHATKEIQIIPFMDENGQDFPDKKNPAFQMQVGDQYHFIDINLPDSYIENAEEELEEAGLIYYDQYKQPQVQYSLSIHPRFLEKYTGAGITNIFSIGDQIHVQDESIGVDKNLRITGFTRNVLDPFRYTLTLSEAAYSKTIINRIISDINNINNVIVQNKLGDPFRARRNWMASQELLSKIFDQDGYYYSEGIRPLSIETSMLQVAARTQQLVLENTRFEPNHQSDENRINIIAGQLVHFTIEESIKTWNLTGGVVTDLTPGKSYIVYAKCEKAGGNGLIILDEAQYRIDQDPNYYHFVLGHLSSVITDPDGSNGARILSLTYGSTTINGRFIRTGRIESSGGANMYIDLDEGIIAGDIRFLSGGNEKSLEDWADYIEQDLDNIGNTADEAQATANLAKTITDKFGTTIDGGLVQTVAIQLREADSEVVTAGTSGIQGDDEDLPAFWAGGTYAEAIANEAKAIIRHDGSSKFADTDITGKISSKSGDIGGFEIAANRIGKTQTGSNPTNDGLALYNEFIKFSEGDNSIFLGVNVAPGVLGVPIMGALRYGGTGEKVGLHFDIHGADPQFWDGGSLNVALNIKRGVINGFRPNGANVTLTSSGYTIGTETVVVIYTNADYTVRLPANPEPWEYKHICGVNDQNYTLHGNGKYIWSRYQGDQNSITFNTGVLVFDGTKWRIM